MYATKRPLLFIYAPTLMRDLPWIHLSHKHSRKGIPEIAVQPSQVDMSQSYNMEEWVKDVKIHARANGRGLWEDSHACEA